MSAFALHVVTAVCFGLSALLTAFRALEHWSFRELGAALSWVALSTTFAVLSALYALQAAGG